MDLLRTDRTYATRENALRALASKVELSEVRYLIACDANGRFAPVLIGAEHSHLIHHGISVVA